MRGDPGLGGLVLLGALAWCACEGPPPPARRAPARVQVPPAPAPVEAPPAPPEPPRPPPPDASRVLPAGDRARLVATLRSGRRAARTGRFAAALAALERAVEIVPSSADVRCEAAFVAYQAADLARADAHLLVALAALPPDAALREEPARRGAAMCLYNAGLIHESLGREPAALEAYRRSVALRPNVVAQGRLDALAVRLGPDAPHRRAPDLGLGALDPALPFAELVPLLRRSLCVRGGGGFEAGRRCASIRAEIRRFGRGALEGAILDFTARHEAGGDQLWTVLAVRGGGRLEVGLVGEGYSPGIFGMSVEITQRPEVRDVLPGGERELVVEVDAQGSDSDMGTCDFWGSEHRSSIVCSTDGGSLRCAALPIVSVDVEQHEVCGDVLDADDDGDHDEPLAGEVAVDRRDGYELRLDLRGGRAMFRRDPEGRSAGTPPLIGEQSLDALLDRPDLAFPSAWTPLDLSAG